jgi:hypothetical protein
MMSKGALFLGAVALFASAGCTSGPRSVAVDPTSGGDGTSAASPRTIQNPPQRCSSGVYNRAADLCVSEGP